MWVCVCVYKYCHDVFRSWYPIKVSVCFMSSLDNVTQHRQAVDLCVLVINWQTVKGTVEGKKWRGTKRRWKQVKGQRQQNGSGEDEKNAGKCSSGEGMNIWLRILKDDRSVEKKTEWHGCDHAFTTTFAYLSPKHIIRSSLLHTGVVISENLLVRTMASSNLHHPLCYIQACQISQRIPSYFTA